MTELEIDKNLKVLWHEIFLEEKFKYDPEENLLGLGVDSVKVSQLVYRVFEVFEVELDLHLVFDTPTFNNIKNIITVAMVDVSSLDKD